MNPYVAITSSLRLTVTKYIIDTEEKYHMSLLSLLYLEA